MALSSLLVDLDDQPACHGRVRLAAALARQHGARLSGLACTGSDRAMPSSHSAAHHLDVAQREHDAALTAALALLNTFQGWCVREGLREVDVLAAEGAAVEALAWHAHLTDLLVLTNTAHDRGLIEKLIPLSVRPLLLLPPHLMRADAGHEAPFARVMVAWDDSRASARAVSDALPVLRAAAAVEVCSWVGQEGPPSEAIALRLDGVRQWLQHHGVACSTALEPLAARGKASLGTALLERSRRVKADLLVMGAYGHARWTERVLGGVTRHVLARADVPLWMSH